MDVHISNADGGQVGSCSSRVKPQLYVSRVVGCGKVRTVCVYDGRWNVYSELEACRRGPDARRSGKPREWNLETGDE